MYLQGLDRLQLRCTWSILDSEHLAFRVGYFNDRIFFQFVYNVDK